MPRAKRLCVSEKIDRFQPICFTLAVVTVENINATSTVDGPVKVSEALSPDRFKQHLEILPHASVRPDATVGNPENKTSAIIEVAHA